MRTTVRLDDELYRRAKEAAARAGCPVGSVIEDALRTFLDRPLEVPEVSPLPVYGGAGVLPGVDLTSNAALRDVMEEGTPADALR